MPEPFSPLAVIGVSALFPGSVNGHGFWRDILAGVDLIRDVPPRRWLIEDHYDPDPRAPDKTYCKRGSFLDDVNFDPIEFGVPPSAMSATDTCQLLALIVAKQVLDDALDGEFRGIDRERASVILGVTSGQELFLEVASRLQAPVWTKALRESGIPEEKVREIRERIAASYVPWQENTFPGLLGNVVAGRIANRFDLGGTNCVTDAACASSLSALSMAAAQLQLGNSDLVITGGADTFNDVSMFVCFSKTPALSPTGDCRPFSDQADGTVLGEGLAMVALRRLEDAERDGNRIYAVIRGIGSSSDGRSKSIYAPLAGGQAKAMRRAYESAGYGPETVQLVEAHGTGTMAGDAAEIESTTSVFAASAADRKQWCALGSVKSQIGHAKAAAGAAGLFKAVMALHHKVLPPTIKVERPNPAFDLASSPFYINTRTRPWVRSADHPRRASVSAFGFGGTNFHVTLEEYASGILPQRRWTAPAELILVGAKNSSDLAMRCRSLAELAEKQPLAQTALESQFSFDAGAAQRLAIVCESSQDLRRIQALAETGARAPGLYRGDGNKPGRVAFLFPGQGSQYVGMTGDLAMAFEDCIGTWDAASAFAPAVFPPPVFSTAEREVQTNRLAATESAQPAIGAASAALLAILNRLGVAADCVAGHSFGEITALFAAGIVNFDAMLEIARRRGELMAAASPGEGAMLSVAMDGASLQQRIEEWGLDLVVANHNSSRQAVLSGKRICIDEAASRCAAAGLAAILLPVSTAFHSPLVRPAVRPFQDFLKTCKMERRALPVYSNFDGGLFAEDPKRLQERLAKQLSHPVRFQPMVERMYADGVRTFIEVGPSAVLTSLVGAILADRPHEAIALDRPRAHGVTSLWHGLGQMAALGIPMNWRALRERHQVEKASAQGADRFAIRINGGNYGRPYPPPGGAAALPKPVSTPIAVPVQSRSGTPSAPELGQAYKIFQESISEAHRNWQANLAKGHESFLRAMETAYLGTVGQTGGQAAEAPVSLRAPAALPAFELPSVPASAVPASAVPAPAPGPEAAAESPAQHADANVRDLLWSVVASATGYPPEMLEARMSLEADLGIDSIKRVEIFSALQERLPAVGEFEPASIAGLSTLGEIAAYLDGHASPAADIANIVLMQIGEKTGYPVETLHRDMSLEADLGIDSIKRVEIFSALQEKFPRLAEIDTAALGDLRSIADVIEFFSAPGSRSVSVEPPRVELSETIAAIARHAVVEMVAPPVGHRTLDLTDGPVAITNDGVIAPLLAQHLRDRGYEARVVDSVSASERAVISLEGLRGDATVNWDVLRMAQTLAPRFAAESGVLVVARDIHNPRTGGLSGLAKTAAIEWPRARVKSIDVEMRTRTPDEIAVAIMQELVAGGPEIEIALKGDGRRTTPVTVAVSFCTGPNLGPESVIVVSGGARGITAQCIIAVARRTAGRFLLLGRSDSDAAAVQETLHALADTGAQARYATLDVRDRIALAAALDETRREWGSITGVIHGAGILADHRIENLTGEQFDSVFSTKVEGLQALLDATRGDPLDILCVFSSVAARYGNAGQAAYAMANEAMNHMARAEAVRRGDATLVKVIDWGPWEGGMVTPALARRFAAQGVSILGFDQGAAAFVEELVDAPAKEIEVIRGSAHPAGSRELRVRIDRHSHPFLADHRIQDVPILPAVEALELFLRCAGVQGGAAPQYVCTNFRVLRGVRLDHFHDIGNLLFIRPRGEGVYEITGPGGVRHYEATLLPDPDRAELAKQREHPGPMMDSPWTSDEIYGKLLFHGPAFQVIQKVSGISSRGILGTVTGTVERQWRDGYRRSDAAMLDGGLQLARLWGFHSLGKLTLPARIGEIRTSKVESDEGRLDCRVTGRTAGANKIVCEVAFTSSAGNVVAVMSDVEMYAAPSE